VRQAAQPSLIPAETNNGMGTTSCDPGDSATARNGKGTIVCYATEGNLSESGQADEGLDPHGSSLIAHRSQLIAHSSPKENS
jgi:hypothetical protein